MPVQRKGPGPPACGPGIVRRPVPKLEEFSATPGMPPENTSGMRRQLGADELGPFVHRHHPGWLILFNWAPLFPGEPTAVALTLTDVEGWLTRGRLSVLAVGQVAGASSGFQG